MRDLAKAVETKYGKPLHELSGEESQMAGDAMIDPKTGKILSMSSASGQYSGGENKELGAFPKKASKGYKMPGYGKRK